MTNVSITVLRTSDAAKGEVSIPLTSTLDVLKDTITSQCPSLVTGTGTSPKNTTSPISSTSSSTTSSSSSSSAQAPPPPPTRPMIRKRDMRLFHLGRELKSSGRSLSALGIGKFENYLIHLQCRIPKTMETVELDLDDDDDDGDSEEVVGRIGSDDGDDEIIELDDSQDSNVADADAAAEADSGRKRGAGGPLSSTAARGGGEVIDLLDDSDDDDDNDDDNIAVTGTTSASAKRRRT
mmetsp:Transcript_35494/g.77738  ORF Transcript_35494/g.77738 Transcript_35494/m.77738 type:complete len:237 (+) Transcript_35494:245-955(+)